MSMTEVGGPDPISVVASIDPVIRCVGVTKRFGEVRALDGLDLEIPRGIVGYLGPNGAGKSTTLRVLLDLARPDSGTVEVLGLDPRKAGAALRQHIGYLPGELRLDDRFSVRQTLELWARVRGDRLSQQEWPRLCDRLHLDPSRSCRGLSTGNRRKVGLVGAFMARPALLVLDEPTSGLDPLVQAEFQRMIDEVREEGRAVLLSSHVLSEVEHVADHVVILRSGSVVASGSVEHLRSSSRQPFRVRFGAEPPMDELRALGVEVLDVVGHEVRGHLVGPPDPFVRMLASHHVERLLMPEPDLEEAFLDLFARPDHPAHEPSA